MKETGKASNKFNNKAEDGIRDVERSRGLGDVYKRQAMLSATDVSVKGPRR